MTWICIETPCKAHVPLHIKYLNRLFLCPVGESKTANVDGPAKKKVGKSSWDGKRQGQKADDKSDYLSNLGSGQDYNINVDHGISYDTHSLSFRFSRHDYNP